MNIESGTWSDLTGEGPTWHLYVLECSDGSLYCGVTTDLDRRVREHNGSHRGAKSTRGRRPVVLVYSEVCSGRSDALRREHRFKSLSRERKLLFISCGGEDDK